MCPEPVVTCCTIHCPYFRFAFGSRSSLFDTPAQLELIVMVTDSELCSLSAGVIVHQSVLARNDPLLCLLSQVLPV